MKGQMINYNMRCIEIYTQASALGDTPVINYNMRCIEISIMKIYILVHPMINYNMRCIEMKQGQSKEGPAIDKLQHEMY